MSIPVGLETDTNHSDYCRAEAPETFLLLPFSALGPSFPVGLCVGRRGLKGSLLTCGSEPYGGPVVEQLTHGTERSGGFESGS